MNRSALLGAVIALAAVACLLFFSVMVQELNYAADHPFRYGPAKIIATAGGAGALLALAVAVLAWVLLRAERDR
ncbi:MAG TPA: hypothetical protein PKE32_09335 [Miltoncostaeaceae bacterium]|nr:hypothetical protein [Miltoncostaeaceae bacterium]